MAVIHTPVFRRRQWQDTSAPPNLLLFHLGPGLTAPPLQYDLDVSNQVYHRESLKGQTMDLLPNLLVRHPGPSLNTVLNLDANSETYHRETMKGQLPDAPNLLTSVFGLHIVPGQPGSIVMMPAIHTRRQIQDTSPLPNLVANLSQIGAKPFIPTLFDDQLKHRDSLSGQYGRSTIYLPQPEPLVQGEQYTPVFKRQPAQDPFVFPNALILGIAAAQAPFVQRQSEDYSYKRQQAQATYDFPNVVALNLKPTSPFVQSTFPDLQFKRQPPQAPYDFPNVIITQITPNQAPKPFVFQQYESLQWRGAKTQEHFDFPNVAAIFLPPPTPPNTGFRCVAVQPGTYGGIYHQIGDVFDIAFASDYSAYNVNYGPHSATQQFGWMMQVPSTTPLFTLATAQPTPLLPISDPIPPVRFVF